MKKFLIDCFAATIFVFVVLLGIREVSQFDVFNVFDPLGQALDDMELTDITFSRLRLEVPPMDENITIVNIGNLSRAEIALQIQAVSKFKPKVIGVDSFFNCKEGKTDSINCPLAYDTLSNLMLGNAIAEAGNVVMVTKVLQSGKLLKQYGGDIDKYDSLENTDPMIRGNAAEGYANLETNAEHQEDLKTCRRFNPKLRLENGEEQLAFSVQIAMKFDSVKAKKFLSRGKYSEVINYRGNVPDVYKASAEEFGNRYTYLDWYQPFDTTSFLPSIIKDRIVLFGFMGENMNDTSWDDKFITPLNKQFAGKTRPDMYGVVVHANIISMILNENDYIEELAEWQQAIIAFIVCFLNVMIFVMITRKIPLWFDGLSIMFQLIQIVICTFLMMYALYWFNFKLNLTLTLAALALVGTCFEIYNGVLKAGISAIKDNILLTKRKKKVLTTQKQEIS
jgi:CHASE2 domain-containing sensor protein